jgi:hypothetical protein
MTEEQAGEIVADASATAEWLSFFLMTVGWFILLTSVLAFWRVKRWERGILASQPENTQENGGRSAHVISQITTALSFGPHGHADMVRQGLGFGSAREREERETEEVNQAVNTEGAEREPMLPIDHDSNSDRGRSIEAASENERRIRQHLRAALF